MTAKILAALETIDGALAARGVPPASAFWKEQRRRFYLHPTARTLLAMVGRGGDKTRESVKQSIAEVLEGDFTIPPGERHYFIHISENVDEAQKTLAILKEYLAILSIPHHPTGDTVDLKEMQRGWKVRANRIGAASGFRSIGGTGDERDKWGDGGSDPSSEVAANMRAMLVTHPNARLRFVSSPVVVGSSFCEQHALGDTDHQVTCAAPSWVANASITEARTHELEPDPRVWAREYAAIHQASACGVVDAEDVKLLTRTLAQPIVPCGQGAIFIDSSSGRGDGFSFCRAQHVLEDGRAVVHVTEVGAFEGKFGRTTSFDRVAAYVANLAKRTGCFEVHGDQHQAFALKSEFGRHRLGFSEHPWTLPTKIDAATTLRRLLREGALVVESTEQGECMRRELLQLEEKYLSDSGQLTIQPRRTGAGHADRAMLLLLVARVVGEGRRLRASAPLPGGAPVMNYGLRQPQVYMQRRSGIAAFLHGPTNDPGAPQVGTGAHEIAVPQGPGQQPQIARVDMPRSPVVTSNGGGRGWGGAGHVP